MPSGAISALLVATTNICAVRSTPMLKADFRRYTNNAALHPPSILGR